MGCHLPWIECALLIASAVGLEFRLETIDGQTATGRLDAVSGDSVTLTTPQGPETVSQKRILTIAATAHDGPPDASQPFTSIQLIDGSRILASDYWVEGGRARLASGSAGLVPCSLRLLSSVRFGHTKQLADDWRAIVDQSHAGDVLVIRKTSQAAEKEATVLDLLEGTLGDVDDEKINFEFDGTNVQVPRSRVEGLIYHRPSPPRGSNPRCQLLDTAGSTWVLRDLGLREGKLQLTTVAGLRVQLPIAAAAVVDYSIGNLSYLVDLPIESTEYRPLVSPAAGSKLLAHWFKPRPEPARHGSNRGSDKTLRMHSYSVVSYRLRNDYQRLLATAVIDAPYQQSGGIQLLIAGDRGMLLDTQILGSDGPRDVELDVRGVRRLTITVDFGVDGDDAGDHLLLKNARLVK